MSPLAERALDAFLANSHLGGANPATGDEIAGLVGAYIEQVVAEGKLTNVGEIVEEATERADAQIDEILAQAEFQAEGDDDESQGSELGNKEQGRHAAQQRALMDANPRCYESALDAVWGYFEDLEEEGGGWPDWLTSEVCDVLFDLFDPGLEPEDMASTVAEHIRADMEDEEENDDVA